ncbi:NAD(P)/FAD-dependent oxidoreductase [Pseudoflavitalea sp. X16]|uniref:NAD(P)/FAD-dependent oxidoreductase n=1 Tax=Paraflavitalea devenefica TaxID=2716334 RepID=UPI0014235BAF|nr:NAD(P)/FAD-dependent oxidoreductase [Paraflavitalea devenefica]NII26456.1 NAD(P)/FAD-dependent oxidoreductase [Paraflavitalea devenefica]
MEVFDYEVAVVGGSHAGLAAAHTLGRSKRSTIVFDTGNPRNKAASRSHNFSAHDGTSPDALRSLAQQQLQQFPHVRYSQQPVTEISISGAGYRLTVDEHDTVEVRKVILATGVTDHLLPIEGLIELWGNKVFHCIYCHGWEARDQPALVLVKGAIAWEVAMTISQWNSQLTFLLHGSAIEDTAKKEQLLQRGWKLVETPVVRVIEQEGEVVAWLADGQVVSGPVAYSKPVRVQFNNELAGMLGCEMSKSGSVLTDAGMQTSVPGVFACGDLSHPGYHQVSEAISTGHKAAAFCNNQLCMEDFVK